MIIFAKKLRRLIHIEFFTEWFLVTIARSYVNDNCSHLITLKDATHKTFTPQKFQERKSYLIRDHVYRGTLVIRPPREQTNVGGSVNSVLNSVTRK